MSRDDQSVTRVPRTRSFPYESAAASDLALINYSGIGTLRVRDIADGLRRDF